MWPDHLHNKIMLIIIYIGKCFQVILQLVIVWGKDEEEEGGEGGRGGIRRGRIKGRGRERRRRGSRRGRRRGSGRERRRGRGRGREGEEKKEGRKRSCSQNQILAKCAFFPPSMSKSPYPSSGCQTLMSLRQMLVSDPISVLQWRSFTFKMKRKGNVNSFT